MVSALAAALAVSTALAALAPTWVLLLAVALAQGLLVSRWFAALDAPGSTGGMLVAGAAALAADVLVVVRDERHPLAPLAIVLGLTLVAALLMQLLRRDGRPRVTTSIVATTSLAVLAVLGAAHLGADLSRGGAALVVVAALAAGAVTALAAVPLPWRWPTLVRSLAGLARAVLVALAVGALSDLGVGTAALVGLACAATAALTGAFTSRLARPEPFVSAALPLLLVGPVAFVLGRLLVG
ncbi:MAG: hypothetical protein ACXV4A_04135 [Actinomycetes bacterium]